MGYEGEGAVQQEDAFPRSATVLVIIIREAEVEDPLTRRGTEG